MTNFIKIGIITTLIAASANLSAQTKVRGTVTDAETGEPLPFANVVFPGTTVGTITDPDGNYYRGWPRGQCPARQYS